MVKKIFSILCTLLLAVQFASASKSLYVIYKSGELVSYPANRIVADNDPLTFANWEVTDVTESTFKASFSVAFKHAEYKTLGNTAEVGICFSEKNESPTIADANVAKTSLLGNHTITVYGLDAGTAYYYRAYFKARDVVLYSEVRRLTTAGTKQEYTIVNGHEFVDLGLPSGLLWAACNIGAEKSADDGDYFAWGETATKAKYGWDTYKHGTSKDHITKYCSSDKKTTLDNEDDAAYVNWGTSCRIPTPTDFTELLNADNCKWEWTEKPTSSGTYIRGYKVTSTKNGNSIFFPASGEHMDIKINNDGLAFHNTFGYYWTNTLDNSENRNAKCLLISKKLFDYDHNVDYDYREFGCPVRPVANK